MSLCVHVSMHFHDDGLHLAETDAWLPRAGVCVCVCACVRFFIFLEPCQAQPKAAIAPCDRLQLMRRGPP